MSGVVVTMNDDDDDEDVTGLLGEPSSAASRFKRYNNKPYPVVRSGNISQWLNTLVLCCVFFGMGLTKSLLEPIIGTEIASSADPSQTQMASSVGYVVGFLIGGFLLAKFNRFFLMLLTMLILSSVLMIVPWTNSLWAVDTVYTIIGVAVAILMVGGNVACLDFWGRKSGPYIQALHFCLSLGLLIGPLLIDPIAQSKVPKIVQKALPNITKPSTLSPLQTGSSFNLNQQPHIIRKRSLEVSPTNDPILSDIFGGNEVTMIPVTSATMKTPKPKPSFTDGRKLDNSRDWEKVKLPKPPKEADTDDSDEDGPSIDEIFGDDKGQKKRRGTDDTDDFIEWIESQRRRKRSIKNQMPGTRTRDPFGQAILYPQQPRVPQPRFPPPQPDWIPPQQRPIPDITGVQWRPPNTQTGFSGDYSPDYGSPYGSFPVDYDTPPPPPEKVQDAIETVKNYFINGDMEENKDKKERTTTVKLTTMTTTTSTTTTTTKTTTPEETTTVVMSTPRVHRNKPTSSFDNDTEQDMTIANILTGYGVPVSHRNIGFILDSVYMIILSVILMLCLCYNPREPRSRQEDGSRPSQEENQIFKYTLTVLLFFFNLLHWGMFVSFREVLPRFTILTSSAPYLQQVFVGVFTTTRFMAVLTAGLVSSSILIFAALLITFVGSLVLVFTQQISAAAVWGGVILQAVGLATLLPTSLVWGETYVVMSSQVVAMICCGLAIGELAVPQLFTRLTIEAQTWLGFMMLGATTLSAGLFLCVWLTARRHGSRFSRPQSSGYELASQDELNQELLEDEDDFEMAEGTLEFGDTKDSREEEA